MDSPSEIAVFVAGSVFVIKLLADALVKLIPKTPVITSEAIEQQTNIKGMLRILEKLNDKGDSRAETLNDVKRTGDRTHSRVGQIEDNTRVLKELYANTKFCKEV